jgi:hypothetical protein
MPISIERRYICICDLCGRESQEEKKFPIGWWECYESHGTYHYEDGDGHQRGDRMICPECMESLLKQPMHVPPKKGSNEPS